MANQSKKFNKFIVSTVAATLVGAAVAPVAGFAQSKDFTDVSGHWAKDAIDYLVGKDAINGYEDGTFKPDNDITRAEAAKILALTLGLEIDENVKTNFKDAKDHWASAYIAAIQDQKEGVINGYENDTFRPDNKITRQEMAKMIVTAYDLKADTKVQVDFTDNNDWGAEFVDVLASLGVVQGMSDGVFAPKEEVTRAQTATFVQRAEMPSKRVAPIDAQLEITNVATLAEDGHVLEVTFNKAVKALDRDDVTVFESSSKARIGVEKVELSKDGKTAIVTLYKNTGANAKPVIAPSTKYTIQLDTISFEFQRAEYVDGAIITEINTEDKEIVISYGESDTKELEIPANLEFDFEEALGQEIRVWYNAKDQVVDYIFETEVQYDAVEIDFSEKEIELVQADQTLDLATGYEVFLNGKNVAETISTDVDYDYAKVVTNDDGKVVRVYAYNWTGSVIVEEVENDYVLGHDEDLDLEDYVIVKNGKQITVDEIKAGDIVYYNTSAANSLGEKGYAEVFNRTVTGEIEDIYDTSFEVDRKSYKFGDAQSLDIDGDIENFLMDEAKAMKDAGKEVTLHLDRKGDLVFVAGDKGDVTTTDTALFVENILPYETSKGKEFMELNFIDADGKEYTEDVALEELETIKLNGETLKINNEKTKADEYSITFNETVASEATQISLIKSGKDNTPKTIQLDDKDNAAFEVVRDANGEIVGFEFYQVDELAEAIADDDKYATTDSNGTLKLSADTVVIDISDEDPEDIVMTKYADVNFDIHSKDAKVYFDGSDVKYVVYTSAEVAEDETYTAVVVDANKKDGDYAQLVAIVNGEKDTFKVDADDFEGDLTDGEVIQITVDTARNEVFEIAENLDLAVTAVVVEVGISKNEVTATVADGEETFKLVADGMVVNAEDPSDITVEEVRDLEKDDKIIVVRDAEGTSYVNTIVKVSEFPTQK